MDIFQDGQHKLKTWNVPEGRRKMVLTKPKTTTVGTVMGVPLANLNIQVHSVASPDNRGSRGFNMDTRMFPGV